MTPETSFARSGELHIGYQVIGDGAIDLVWVPGWLSLLGGAEHREVLARRCSSTAGATARGSSRSLQALPPTRGCDGFGRLERLAASPATAAKMLMMNEMLSEIAVKTDAARMLVWRAGYLKDAGKPNTTETSIAKLYATESAVQCANTAIQVHGGSGYVDDYPVERYLRDVRVTTLYEGTSQIQKLIIGRALTGINALVPS